LRVVLLREIPEDAKLCEQWNALALREETPEVFYTYEWAMSVQHAYRQALAPMIFLGYEERGALCGVAALATDSAQRVSFLCATTGDYCDFVCARDLKPPFVSGVLRELAKLEVKSITLTNLPADSATVPVLRRESRENRFNLFSRPAYECVQASLKRLERRSKDNKLVLMGSKRLRRSLNGIGREGEVRIHHGRTWDEVRDVLPSFEQAHVARFLTTGRISNLARAERRNFLAELARRLSKQGWLTMSRVLVGDRALAWNYGFQFAGTWFWYQPTFVSDLEKYSPGYCLLAKIVEEAAENPEMETVDLGLGAEEYKELFANQRRETLYVTLRGSAVGHLREMLRYRVAQMIKLSPQAELNVRRGVTLLKKARRDGIASVFKAAASRLRGLIWSKSEVIFFEAGVRSSKSTAATRLEPLNLNALASAVSRYAEDPATCDYLLRATARLRNGGSDGFGLVDTDGKFLHFAWITEFDGFFLSELNAKVTAPAPDSVMIFDCWTPTSARGRGAYGQTVAGIARHMRDCGKVPWIFSEASNHASLRGLEKAGCQRRYSLTRHRLFGMQKVKGEIPKRTEMATEEVSSRV